MTTTAEPATLDTLDDTGRALLFTEARTANAFADVPVTEQELTGIWDLARWSPSMANSHGPWGRPDMAAFLFTRAIVAGEPIKVFNRGEMYRDTFSGMPGEALEGIAKHSAAIQTGVFLLAVRAHGLAAGPMAGFDGPGIDAEFFAGTTWKTHLVVNIGHPGVAPWFDRLPRLDRDTALAWA